MKCIYCGAMNPDNNRFCGQCGEKLFKEPKMNNDEKKVITEQGFISNAKIPEISNNKSTTFVWKSISDINDRTAKSKISPSIEISHQKNKFIIPSILVAILIIASLGYLLIKDPLAYRNANQYLSSGQYEKASTAFTKLGNYKDSANLVLESKYQLAIYLSTDGKFNTACSILSDLGSYKDSANLLIEYKYQWALAALYNKNYQSAFDLFSSIENYKDSANLKSESKYQSALLLISSKNYKDAIGILSSLGDYKDSPDLLLETNYQWAKYLYDLGFYPLASEILKPLGNYKDSLAMLGKANDEIQRYSKINSTAPHFPSINTKSDPSIGMTASEVMNSSWGKPIEINRTTTAFGVSEQWVYSDYRYIYLDDGVVTAIQDH